MPIKIHFNLNIFCVNLLCISHKSIIVSLQVYVHRLNKYILLHFLVYHSKQKHYFYHKVRTCAKSFILGQKNDIKYYTERPVDWY